MILDYLTVKNVYGLDDYTHEYLPGVTGLMGHVGSGKSSFGEYAQYFAITGNVPATVGKKEDLISWGKSSGSTELGFTHDGIEYTLKRNLHNSSVKLEWEEGGAKEKKTQKDANDLVFDMLGMSPEVFYECCFVRQGGLWDILLMTHADRMKYFQKITGTIRAEKLRKLLNEASARLPSYPDRTEAIAEAIAKIDQAERSIEAIDKEKGRAAKKLEGFDESLESIIGKLQGSLSETDWKAKKAAAEWELKEAKEKLAKTKEGMLKACGEMPPRPRKRDDSLSEKHRRYEIWLAGKDGCEKALASLKTLGKEIEECRSELTKAEKKLEAVVKKRDDVVAKKGDMERDLEAAEKELQLARQGKCPTCSQDVKINPEEAKRRVDKIEKSLEAARIAYNEMLQPKLEAEKLVNDWRATLSDKERQKTAAEARTEGYDPKAFDDYDPAPFEKAAAAAKAYEEWESKTEAYKPHIEAAQQRITRAETSLEHAEKAAYITDAEAERLTKQRNEMAAISNAIRDCDAKIAEHKAVKSSQTTLKESYEADMAKQAEIIEYKERIEVCKKYLHRDMLPKIVMGMLRASLAYEVHVLLKNFDMPFTVELNSEFDYVVHWGNHRDRPITSLSGGQKIVVSICHHLALANILADSLPLLFIDEPTNHLGAEEKVLVRECLFTLRKSAGQSTPILVATHEPALQAAFARTHRFSRKAD